MSKKILNNLGDFGKAQTINLIFFQFDIYNFYCTGWEWVRNSLMVVGSQKNSWRIMEAIFIYVEKSLLYFVHSIRIISFVCCYIKWQRWNYESQKDNNFFIFTLDTKYLGHCIYLCSLFNGSREIWALPRLNRKA